MTFVSDHLREQGVDVVLSGGSCVTIYSRNRYQSFDLDFVDTGGGGERKNIKSALLNLGFSEKNKYFIHPESEYFVEFPSGPLAVGSEAVKEVVELVFPTGRLRLLSPTDCVKDLIIIGKISSVWIRLFWLLPITRLILLKLSAGRHMKACWTNSNR